MLNIKTSAIRKAVKTAVAAVTEADLGFELATSGSSFDKDEMTLTIKIKAPKAGKSSNKKPAKAKSRATSSTGDQDKDKFIAALDKYETDLTKRHFGRTVKIEDGSKMEIQAITSKGNKLRLANEHGTKLFNTEDVLEALSSKNKLAGKGPKVKTVRKPAKKTDTKTTKASSSKKADSSESHKALVAVVTPRGAVKACYFDNLKDAAAAVEDIDGAVKVRDPKTLKGIKMWEGKLRSVGKTGAEAIKSMIGSDTKKSKASNPAKDKSKVKKAPTKTKSGGNAKGVKRVAAIVVASSGKKVGLERSKKLNDKFGTDFVNSGARKDGLKLSDFGKSVKFKNVKAFIVGLSKGSVRIMDTKGRKKLVDLSDIK